MEGRFCLYLIVYAICHALKCNNTSRTFCISRCFLLTFIISGNHFHLTKCDVIFKNSPKFLRCCVAYVRERKVFWLVSFIIICCYQDRPLTFIILYPYFLKKNVRYRCGPVGTQKYWLQYLFRYFHWLFSLILWTRIGYLKHLKKPALLT